MIGNQVLERQHALAVDRDDPAMATVTQSVPCERCGRSVLVALSPLHPPCFQHVDEQVECPEIQERRGKGEGGLLLMMCGALKRSLEARSESAEVEAAAQDRRWHVVCRIPGVSSARYSPQEARGRAEIWDAHGHKKLAVRLRAAAAKAERRQPGRARAAIGLGAMVIAAAGGWFLLAREPRVAPPQPPAAQQPETAAALPYAAATEQPAPGAVTAPAASPATDPAPAAPQAAPSGPTRSLAPEEAPSAGQAPAPEAPIASPAEAASAAAAASLADSTPAAELVPRVPDMVPIPGGTFAMGGADASELPVHQVTIRPFALGKFPVTVREWKECVAANACDDLPVGPDDSPVTNVSYKDTQDYLAWLSRVTGKPFRLPSEAEWEYAARSGQQTKFWWGDQMRAGMANCKGCNEGYDAKQPLKVGSFQANPFGLFDMGGGVDQWIADSWHKNYQGAPVDGSAWVDDEGFARVIRSGSWKNDPSYVRAASRDHYDARVRYPTHGFRVARSL
jgi:formylglycine-generating enzyme required for sulfatase activity